MTRPSSKVAPDWWGYTTLDGEILGDAANLTAEDLVQLSRDGFEVVMYDSLRELYCAEVPLHAATVGPVETWKSDCVSIWHPGYHDNPFGMRLTALMISKKIPDSAVLMSLLADHPRVKFSDYRGGIGAVEAEMK